MKTASSQAAANRAVVFLGGGRITRALLAGLRRAGYDRPMVVHDRHVAKLRQLRRSYGVAVEPNFARALKQARLLIIAVRPESVRRLLEPAAQGRALLAVSLAAGIPLAKLRRWMPPALWARAMPSPAGRSGRGLTALAFDRNFPAARRQEVRDLFARLGAVLEIPESKFDAFTVTYSASHGYHALAALAGAAQKLGLDRRTALTAAAHALGDAIEAWRAGNLSLADLRREAATPGGIASATLASMDKSGYRQIVQRGLRAGVARARSGAKAG
jgi:pyrroline-5-carboxylate reductase